MAAPMSYWAEVYGKGEEDVSAAAVACSAPKCEAAINSIHAQSAAAAHAIRLSWLRTCWLIVGTVVVCVMLLSFVSNRDFNTCAG